jgi:hypothetical protein
VPIGKGAQAIAGRSGSGVVQRRQHEGGGLQPAGVGIGQAQPLLQAQRVVAAVERERGEAEHGGGGTFRGKGREGTGIRCGSEDAVEKPCVCHLLKHGRSPARYQQLEQLGADALAGDALQQSAMRDGGGRTTNSVPRMLGTWSL